MKDVRDIIVTIASILTVVAILTLFFKKLRNSNLATVICLIIGNLYIVITIIEVFFLKQISIISPIIALIWLYNSQSTYSNFKKRRNDNKVKN